MVNAYLIFLSVLACERLFELWLSKRNAAWSFARGGIEVGQAHFPMMRLLHTAFFLACAVEVVVLRRPFDAQIGAVMLAIALVAQALRYWAIITLGPRWNVRVIVVPRLNAVARGPYRFLRHPNYVAVVLEGFAVPLMHGAWLTAVAFTVLNGCLLYTRIRCEESALRDHCAYDRMLSLRVTP